MFTLVPLLNDTFFYKRVKHLTLRDYDSKFMNLMDLLSNDADLRDTYTLEKIETFEEYGYVENSNGDIVYMSGIELFGNNCYRIESRTYVPTAFRLRSWNCPHGYAAVQESMKTFTDVNMWFKSRVAKSKYSNLGYSAKYDNFTHDWQLHSTPVELKWENNFQWIYYYNVKGDLNDNLKSIAFQV